MDLYEKLAGIFEIDKLNLDKSNRRTLLKYAKRTKFQKRREAFYSVCKEGKKSKVAICKTDERPTWVTNLETLRTKELRSELKAFLKELGILNNPKYSDVKRLAKDKNWEAVLYLDDVTKTGGAGDGLPESGRSGPPMSEASGPATPAKGRSDPALPD